MKYVYFFSSAILLQTKIAFYLAHELEINIYHDDRLLIYIDNLYDKKDTSLREFISDANDVFDIIRSEAIRPIPYSKMSRKISKFLLISMKNEK